MGLPPLDFAIVVHDQEVDRTCVFDVLEAMNVSPLNIVTFSEWVECTYNPEFNILCIKKNGEIIFADSASDKIQIRTQIELEYK